MDSHLRYTCVQMVIFAELPTLPGVPPLSRDDTQPNANACSSSERTCRIAQAPSKTFEIVFKFHSGFLPNWPRPPQTHSPSFKRLNLN